MKAMYPILEFDASKTAVIEPRSVLKPIDDLPEHCVMCFFQSVIGEACGDGKAQYVGRLASEIGANPVYVLTVNDEVSGEERRVTVVHPGVGAPLAAAFLEETIAFGCNKFVACGGAGVLNGDLAAGHVVIPTSAIRDEGTSYHYLPPAREVAGSEVGIRAIEATLERHGVPYVAGKTWTTDAIYRETPAKVAARREEGCITVEMEAATFFAVAQFRGVEFAQILYAGDDVSGETWDERDWIHGRASTREQLFWLSIEAVLRM
jgi:uridine phosphorylase